MDTQQSSTDENMLGLRPNTNNLTGIGIIAENKQTNIANKLESLEHGLLNLDSQLQTLIERIQPLVRQITETSEPTVKDEIPADQSTVAIRIDNYLKHIQKMHTSILITMLNLEI